MLSKPTGRQGQQALAPAFKRFLTASAAVESKESYKAREIPAELATTLNVRQALPRRRRASATLAWSWWMACAPKFYDPEWMPTVTTFDSFEELACLLDTPIRTVQQHAAVLTHNAQRQNKVLSAWRSLILDTFPVLKA